MDKEKFFDFFEMMFEYYNEPPFSEAKMNIYYMALSSLTIEELENAFMLIIKNRPYKNFPQVAEILEYANGTSDELLKIRITMAKESLKKAILKLGAYQSIEFKDKGIHAVIDSVGGWQKICVMNIQEFTNFLKFEFEKIYKAYAKVKYKVTPQYLGIFDQDNKTLNINKIDYYGENTSLIEYKPPVNTLENKSDKGAEVLKKLGLELRVVR